MLDQNLLNYIQESQKLGSSKEQISKALIDNGWEAGLVEEGLKSFDSGINISNIPQAPVAPLSSDPISQSPLSLFLEKYSIFIGLGEVIISGIIFFLYFSTIINASIAIYIAIFEVLVGFIGSIILFILTKVFKISNNSFGKALFFSGSVGVTAAILQLLNLIHIPLFISGLLSLVLLVGSFILLAKLYVLTVGRAIKLGIVNIVITTIIGVILVFMFTLFGLFKIESLFQGSNNIKPLGVDQSNPVSLSNTNGVPTTNDFDISKSPPIIGQEATIQDCGSITDSEAMIIDASKNDQNDWSDVDHDMKPALAALECFNQALVNCSAATITSIGETMTESGETVRSNKDLVFNISSAKTNDMCILNECIIPREAIQHRSETHKRKLFLRLLGWGPGAGMTVDGQQFSGISDGQEVYRYDASGDFIYDPITKKITENVCPPGKNPFY
jgi:hypothetical protein